MGAAGARRGRASDHDWARLPDGHTLLLIALPRQVPGLGPNPVADQGIYEVNPRSGFLCEAVVVSDDAGQFNVGHHALCWVYAERLVHKLDAFTEERRRIQRVIRTLLWWFYRDLLAFKREPTARRRAELKARFDRIFKRQTGFVILDRLFKRLHADKAELLAVLDRPEIPLHTNGSENDIRCQVIRRRISGGTRSDDGRACRDAILGLAKTCRKLGVSFWGCLGDRLAVLDVIAVPPPPDLVRKRAAPA